MTSLPPDTEELLNRSVNGDHDARGEVLLRHRDRLRRMVELRLDRRLAPRLDPSDIVQDVLADADRRLEEYVRERPFPFYAWLRRLALDRLADAHRRHVTAARRSVSREEAAVLPESSALELVARLAVATAGPSEVARQQELHERVQLALETLSGSDREILVLRHLEQLTAREVAAILGLSEAAVKSRSLRAIQRLRDVLGGDSTEDRP